MKTKLTQTRNGFPEKTRLEVTARLPDRLANSIDLMMQAKQAHWNVKGPHFIPLHELFNKIFTDTGACVDIVAERIVQLGGIAQDTIPRSCGTIQPAGVSSTRHFQRSQTDRQTGSYLAFYREMIRETITLTTQLDEVGPIDILNQVFRGADLNLWLAEAHEQEQQH